MFVCVYAPHLRSILRKRPAAYPDGLTEFIEYTQHREKKKHKNKAMSNITQTIREGRKKEANVQQRGEQKWAEKKAKKKHIKIEKYIKKFQNDEVKVNDDADHWIQ